MCTITLSSCNYSNVDYIKKEAPEFLESQGFEINVYHGYESDLFFGGNVWYTVKDKDGYIYELALQRWKDELHIYNLTCLNAVSK